MAYMYGGTILLVNLTERKTSKEPTTSYSGAFLGGRGINIKILYDGVPPEISPLDPASLLIFGLGPMCGTPVPASRTEVTAKSPETGFLGSSSFGGYFAPELKFAGYDHIVISGKADRPVYIWIDNERVEIKDASKIWGKDTFETQAIIRSEVNAEAKVACIGQAGENLVHFATVQHELGHAAGRTGMGAVMGSKNLKAIVVRGTKGITLSNTEKYLSIVDEMQQDMRCYPGIQERQKHGYSLRYARQAWKRAELNQTPRPSVAYDLVLKYKPKRSGCFGCLIQCMDLYPVEAFGGGAVSCRLYISPFTTVRNTDPELLLECSLWAQRYGIDINSSMAIIAWLMELYEKGLITTKDTDGIPMEWGSQQAIIGMFKKMVHREGFGDVLADGILPAAEKIGRGSRDYADQVKGLPLFTTAPPTTDSFIPSKGIALGSVVSSRGDHLRAMTTALEEASVKEISLLCDEKRGTEYIEATQQILKQLTGTEKATLPQEYEGKPEIVIYIEDGITINDCLGICKNIGRTFSGYPFAEKYAAALFSAGTGVETSEDMLFKFAKKVRNLERAYCVREGMTRDTDVLPKRYMNHAIQRHDSKGAVLESSKFEQMKSLYYALRSWDIATGIPTRETLEKAGLRDIAQDLRKRGKLPRKSPEV